MNLNTDKFKTKSSINSRDIFLLVQDLRFLRDENISQEKNIQILSDIYGNLPRYIETFEDRISILEADLRVQSEKCTELSKSCSVKTCKCVCKGDCRPSEGLITRAINWIKGLFKN